MGSNRAPEPLIRSMPVGQKDCGPAGEAASRETLDVIADKWSIIVIHRLRSGPMRFGELHRSVEGLSRKMLTVTLRGQERFGLITRTVDGSSRLPSVTYALSPLGDGLAQATAPLVAWTLNSLGRLEAARQAYEEQSIG
jgi:DNA-binding HxlR family transcriptional regulator